MERLNRDFVTDDSAAVRELLEGLQQGDSSALDLLIGILYEELRVIAPTSAVAGVAMTRLARPLCCTRYAKLRRQKRISIESRSHFSPSHPGRCGIFSALTRSSGVRGSEVAVSPVFLSAALTCPQQPAPTAARC